MLARNLVMQHGTQPVIVKPTDSNGGYSIIDNRIHILYSIELSWKKNQFRKQERDGSLSPFLASVKADDFLVSTPTYDSAETPFLTWATSRARDLVDGNVLEENWLLSLSDAGSKEYFKVALRSTKNSKVCLKLVQDLSFMWTCFFPANSDIYREIEAHYKNEAV